MFSYYFPHGSWGVDSSHSPFQFSVSQSVIEKSGDRECTPVGQYLGCLHLRSPWAQRLSNRMALPGLLQHRKTFWIQRKTQAQPLLQEAGDAISAQLSPALGPHGPAIIQLNLRVHPYFIY